MSDELVDGQPAAAGGVDLPSTRALLGITTQFVGVAAVTLPLCGYLTRAFAFTFSGRTDGLGSGHLAAAASLPDLAVTGLGALAWGVPVFIVFVLAFVILDRITRSEPHQRHWHNKPGGDEADIPGPDLRRYDLLLFISSVVSAVSVAAYSVVWSIDLALTLLVGIAVAPLGTWLQIKYGQKGVRLGWTWPILVVCLTAGSMGAAFRYTDVPLAEYTLDPSTGVASGWYLELGRSTDTVYLLSCADAKAEVIGVSPASIYRANYAKRTTKPAPEPGLVALLTGNAGPQLGLWTQCP